MCCAGRKSLVEIFKDLAVSEEFPGVKTSGAMTKCFTLLEQALNKNNKLRRVGRTTVFNFILISTHFLIEDKVTNLLSLAIRVLLPKSRFIFIW
ncbi:hypothetical protein GCM10011501_15440 [Thalassotalea profundi]|uniref:Uncharacterized protein n=1 Tax=Thalassotalea profundi TaxID=2036687 RepID=A0ABQ3IMS5_9GAMM|nr:hypothetical protein GCM10011501_15440 [Thalassotalea profundi]